MNKPLVIAAILATLTLSGCVTHDADYYLQHKEERVKMARECGDTLTERLGKATTVAEADDAVNGLSDNCKAVIEAYKQSIMNGGEVGVGDIPSLLSDER